MQQTYPEAAVVSFLECRVALARELLWCRAILHTNPVACMNAGTVTTAVEFLIRGAVAKPVTQLKDPELNPLTM